jgi:hypothetical protein
MKLHFKPLGSVFFLCLSAAGGLLFPGSILAADAPAPAAGASSNRGTDNVARLLFEADVYFNLGEEERARELYDKADSSGKCPEELVAAYQATRGSAEELYKQMQAARNGDMPALAAALGALFYERKDGYAAPDVAFDLYRVAKNANPTGTFQGEAEAAELLKMATAAGPLDLEAFLKTHEISGEKAALPYALWELAQEASIGGRFGVANAGLVLQLISRGGALAQERASAIRWAHANWTGASPREFDMDDHTSFRGGKLSLHAVGLPRSWEDDLKKRCVSLLDQSKQRQIEPLVDSALNVAYRLAVVKTMNLYLPEDDTAGWKALAFFRWQVEQSLRLFEAVFSGFKPKLPKSEANSMESFKRWCAAAALKVPAHLEKSERVNFRGVCLAFSDPEEFRKVLQSCEAFVEEWASVFKKVSPDVAQETWQSFLVEYVQRDLGEEARALERWDNTHSKISENEEKVSEVLKVVDPSERSLGKESQEQAKTRAAVRELDNEDPEETIAAARKGDAVAAQWGIDYLLKTRPRDALVLHRAAKKANPSAKIIVEGIWGAELEDALKLVADLKPFELSAFLKKHKIDLDTLDLWSLARDAAAGRRFRGEGADLTLQLVLRAPRNNPEVHSEPSNYFKAVRDAYNLWKQPSGRSFDPVAYRCGCDKCEIWNGNRKIAELNAAIEMSSTKTKTFPEAVELEEELSRVEREVRLAERRVSNAERYSIIEAELKARKEDLRVLQNGFSSTQKELFEAAREAANEWIGWRSIISDGDDGGIRGDMKHADFQHQGQKQWLKDMEPLLAGYVPSIVYPWVWAQEMVDDLTRKSLDTEDDAVRPENRKGEASAWAEYRDHAARFLFSISPTLSENDWKGWLCQVRRVSARESQTAPQLLTGSIIDSVKEEEEKSASGEHSVEARRERKEQSFEAEFKRIESVLKNPRTFEVDLTGVRMAKVSQDGRLRVLSWNTDTGGTAQSHCSMAQYKAPGFGVESVLLEHPDTEGGPDFRVYGHVDQIDTLVTSRGETVYLLWTSARTATTRSAESVFAVSWNQGRLKNIPFFKTKKSLLQSIVCESSFEQVAQKETPPEFVRPTEGNGYTLLVPIISDNYQFSGKFFEYVFDGELFVFKAVR